MLHARKSFNERVQDSANLIPADEPVFLMRAQDTLSVEATEHYRDKYQAMSGHKPKMLACINTHIEKMKEWQGIHTTKLGDMPSGDSAYDVPEDNPADAEVSGLGEEEEEDLG